ncbi:MAG TPA: 6-phosphogluconolactonase [Planctomycetota bacterium]|jgi:6-phosphogluconolactonase|nr:6-phosphogluconolactonase [Planctomycetota bacterium]OQC20926.1 MAG: 6-phosphogluconolactonase [Planctomycetes bacterium ADurb.Bin069]HNR98422.1 6-phosphogluconolactonase [Planctomycetota bacterium]HNU25158.1 6-phosphogluconolactonase [Planctomycetota bacterium]HOE30146.1 6-phosphogluconolactonase [Planctomycetota bacterium]
MRVIHGKAQELCARAAGIIAAAARAMLEQRARVVLGLPGGRSAGQVFDALARAELPWERIQIFMADERLVPPDHPDSNFRLVKEHLAAPLAARKALPAENLHPFQGGATEEERHKALNTYSDTLRRYGDAHDIMLLSVGEDGHVASLFPRGSVLDDGPMHILVADAPKPPPRRMSISRRLLLRSRAAVLLCLGEAKRDALERLRDPAGDWRDCPARLAAGLPEAWLLTDIAASAAGER